ncbi:MAG: hypothetical protein HDT16_13760 [Oscillibacter sp.]|nr:hypothetical protein [Oscillibacter sp.]MBD5153469.1 hypothetical protein [Oscillibacter sp.]
MKGIEFCRSYSQLLLLYLGMTVFLLQHLSHLLCRVGRVSIETRKLYFQNVGPVFVLLFPVFMG